MYKVQKFDGVTYDENADRRLSKTAIKKRKVEEAESAGQMSDEDDIVEKLFAKHEAFIN